MRRVLLIPLVALVVGASWSSHTQAASSGATPLLPHLTAAKIMDVHVEPGTGDLAGHPLLRFTNGIGNTGAGPFEVHATDRDALGIMQRTYQRVYMSDGSTMDVPLAGCAHYETGDGHHHWHFCDALRGVVTDPTNHVVKVSLAKIGFCFLDDATVPGTTQTNAAYTGHTACSAGDPAATDTLMGIDVGWADFYHYSGMWQWVDLAGVPAGSYRLTVNLSRHWRFDIDYSHSSTWVDFAWNGVDTAVVTRTDPGAWTP